jgi:protein SCO1
MKAWAAAALAAGLAMAAQPGTAALAANASYADRVGFDQHPGRLLPLQLDFRDERGARVRLADYLGAAPAAVVFAYYNCSNLCPTVIHHLAQRLAGVSDPAARSLQVLVVSIDPHDSPAQAAQMKAGAEGGALPGADRWHFLTGEEPAISELARAAGFRYAYDPETRQYAHAAGYILLTPQGRIARYFFGFGFTSSELAQSIDEAAALRISTPIERLLLLCFHYDPLTGRYSDVVMAALRGVSAAALLALLAFGLVRRGRAHRRARRTVVAP